MALLEIIPKALDDTTPPAIAKTYYLKDRPTEGLHLPGNVKTLWIWTTIGRFLGGRTYLDQPLHLTQRLD
jgi:hypothetical protein